MSDLDVMTIPFKNNGGRPAGTNGAEPVDIWKARNFIHEHSADQLCLRSVANAAGISPGHLSEKFRQVTGLNFVDYVARIRVDRACSRLASDNARISEIAFDVGFQSLSQFNRVFKKLSGKSPTEYRAVVRLQNCSKNQANALV